MTDSQIIVVCVSAVGTFVMSMLGLMIRSLIAGHLGGEMERIEHLRGSIEDLSRAVDKLRDGGTEFSHRLEARISERYVTNERLNEVTSGLKVDFAEVRNDIQHLSSAVDQIRISQAEDRGAARWERERRERSEK